MTTIIGFKTNNDSIIIGGDKILTSDRKFPECVNITKIFNLDDDVTIAACGNPMIYEFAQSFVQNKTILKIDRDYNFIKSFRDQFIIPFYKYCQKHAVEKPDIGLIIRYKNRLYSMEADKVIVECEYVAQGSGERYALGAMKTLKDWKSKGDSDKEVANKILSAASYFDLGTGNDFDIIEYPKFTIIF